MSEEVLYPLSVFNTVSFPFMLECFAHFLFFVQENIFEWQFAIRGPRDSEFEGGIYHGRIQLPSEYPFKPPSFMLLTVKFCSNHCCLSYYLSYITFLGLFYMLLIGPVP